MRSNKISQRYMQLVFCETE